MNKLIEMRNENLKQKQPQLRNPQPNRKKCITELDLLTVPLFDSV